MEITKLPDSHDILQQELLDNNQDPSNLFSLNTTDLFQGMEKEEEEVILGIDLGTTNSCVVVMMKGITETVVDATTGDRTVPSIVAFTSEGVLVGKAAKQSRHKIFDAKRFMGRDIMDGEVLKIKDKYPFGVSEGSSGELLLSVPDPTNPSASLNFRPEEIGAHILMHLHRLAHQFLMNNKKDRFNILGCVITVPANFDVVQREATLRAARIAKLTVCELINEPTAAAVAYGYGMQDNRETKVLVFDLGGGTFDLTLMKVGQGKSQKRYEVLYTDGITNLGGRDWDHSLAAFVQDLIQSQGHVLSEPKKMHMILTAEEVKKSLTTVDETDFTVLGVPNGDEEDFIQKITISDFNSITKRLFERAFSFVTQLVKDKEIVSETLDVLLVGGSTRMREVSTGLEKIFQVKPRNSKNVDEIVAEGAAVYGQNFSLSASTKVLLMDITALNLGVEVISSKRKQSVVSTIIPLSTRIPCRKEKSYHTTYDNQNIVAIKVYQGKMLLPENNKLIGEFHLKDLSPLPAGHLRISIIFQLDQEGKLLVTAGEMANDGEMAVSKSLTIELLHQISESKMEEMIQRANNLHDDLKGKKGLKRSLESDDAPDSSSEDEEAEEEEEEDIPLIELE